MKKSVLPALPEGLEWGPWHVTWGTELFRPLRDSDTRPKAGDAKLGPTRE